MSSPPKLGSRLGSLKHLAESILEAFRTRAELISLEWQEEKKRLLILLISVVVGAVIGFLFLFAFTVAVIVSAWETDYRYAVAWGICAFYALLTGLAALITIRQVRQATPPFKATIEEIRKDYSWLRSQS